MSSVVLTPKGCQDILNQLIEYEDLDWLMPPITLNVRGIKQGYTKLNSRRILIPQWALANLYCGKWYVIHEIAHVVTRLQYGIGVQIHGLEFMKVENRLLGLYGLTLKRNKVYPKAIYFHGVEVYHREGL